MILHSLHTAELNVRDKMLLKCKQIERNTNRQVVCDGQEDRYDIGKEERARWIHINAKTCIISEKLGPTCLTVATPLNRFKHLHPHKEDS